MPPIYHLICRPRQDYRVRGCAGFVQVSADTTPVEAATARVCVFRGRNVHCTTDRHLLRRPFICCVISASLLLLAGSSASADESSEPETAPKLTWSYLHKGGAVPFVYGASASLVAALATPPRTSPLLFDASEGGEEYEGSTVPSFVVAVNGSVTGLAIAMLKSPARWYHVKGFAQGWVTSALITRLAKVSFGRHRPDYQMAETTDNDARASFFSGHASATLAQTTYLALYLRHHVFKRSRGSSVITFWEGATYAALAAASVYVPYTRVDDNRHHPVDVIAGAGVGMAAAAAFFVWQERRFRRSRSPLQFRDASRKLLLFPDKRISGITLLTDW